MDGLYGVFISVSAPTDEIWYEYKVVGFGVTLYSWWIYVYIENRLSCAIYH